MIIIIIIIIIGFDLHYCCARCSCPRPHSTHIPKFENCVALSYVHGLLAATVNVIFFFNVST